MSITTLIFVEKKRRFEVTKLVKLSVEFVVRKNIFEKIEIKLLYSRTFLNFKTCADYLLEAVWTK